MGISAARGIGLAAGIPVVGVATLSGFLAPLMAGDSRGLFASAIDAKHGHIYIQAIAFGGKSSSRLAHELSGRHPPARLGAPVDRRDGRRARLPPKPARKVWRRM